MSLALDAQVLLSILAHETSSGDISRTLRATPASYSLSLAYGTGANQATQVWSDSGSVDANGTTFNTTALADVVAGVQTQKNFGNLKCVYVRNTSAAASMTLAFAQWTGLPSSMIIRSQGVFIAIAPNTNGYATAGLGHSFTLSSSIGASYEVLLIGH